MSARNRARRNVPRQERAAHLAEPAISPGVAVREAIETADPVPEHPVPVTVEEPADRERRLAQEAADRLPRAIAMPRPQPHVPAVPLSELRAWLEAHAPKVWAQMTGAEVPKRRKGAA